MEDLPGHLEQQHGKEVVRVPSPNNSRELLGEGGVAPWSDQGLGGEAALEPAEARAGEHPG